LYSLLLEI